jgi:hypothetical protein
MRVKKLSDAELKVVAVRMVLEDRKNINPYLKLFGGSYKKMADAIVACEDEGLLIWDELKNNLNVSPEGIKLVK